MNATIVVYGSSTGTCEAIAEKIAQKLGCEVINVQDLTTDVVLLSLPDSTFVQGAMTDEQGMFKIVTNVTNGVFKVSSVGYQTLYINAGEGLTIQMKEDTQILGEVVVKSQLPKTHAKGDAMRTTVAGTILEKAGTVSDALSKTT